MKTEFGVRVYKEYFHFSSSHFLIFEDGTREELHGHNYRVRVGIRGDLGPGDMVLDFCKLKPIVRRYCDSIDHRTLLPSKNGRLEIREDGDSYEVAFRRLDDGRDRFVFPRRDVVLLPIANTSTERLAEFLGGKILASIREELKFERLRSFEIEVEEAGGQCGGYRVEL